MKSTHPASNFRPLEIQTIEIPLAEDGYIVAFALCNKNITGFTIRSMADDSIKLIEQYQKFKSNYLSSGFPPKISRYLGSITHTSFVASFLRQKMYLLVRSVLIKIKKNKPINYPLLYEGLLSAVEVFNAKANNRPIDFENSYHNFLFRNFRIQEKSVWSFNINSIETVFTNQGFKYKDKWLLPVGKLKLIVLYRHLGMYASSKITICPNPHNPSTMILIISNYYIPLKEDFSGSDIRLNRAAITRNKKSTVNNIIQPKAILSKAKSNYLYLTKYLALNT